MKANKMPKKPCGIISYTDSFGNASLIYNGNTIQLKNMSPYRLDRLQHLLNTHNDLHILRLIRNFKSHVGQPNRDDRVLDCLGK